jgi:hypothetical protein
VIGGTSLFGGKGKVINAVIGGAVIAVIDTAWAWMGFSSGTQVRRDRPDPADRRELSEAAVPA